MVLSLNTIIILLYITMVHYHGLLPMVHNSVLSTSVFRHTDEQVKEDCPARTNRKTSIFSLLLMLVLEAYY